MTKTSRPKAPTADNNGSDRMLLEAIRVDFE
jgi:hypothetical protein